jgi:hypothetical protein
MEFWPLSLIISVKLQEMVVVHVNDLRVAGFNSNKSTNQMQQSLKFIT